MASRHQLQHEHPHDIFHHPHDTHHHSKLPVIPDLRFEYSYLRSIRRYVHIERIRQQSQQHHSSVDELLKDYERVELHTADRADAVVAEEQSRTASPIPREVVHVQWKKVLWVTTRDQVISPLLQGALWAIASYFLTPYSAQVGSKLGQLVRGNLPSKEGTGAGWLREWVKGLGLTTSKSAEGTKR